MASIQGRRPKFVVKSVKYNYPAAVIVMNVGARVAGIVIDSVTNVALQVTR
ncbi:hypothetical protein M0D69_15715 [Caballeronia sp. SEWSISQ10-4 2]|uniref:hypothetical protein n=1 Tax=Caballeronia sp. SEWSISQ10-4 2 TaxID=2937438 RepID=UPI00264CE523|nr:hypothetical protein [Caballeronia sp. SEWSISQ10-4 2]MDN7179411.1 hypothetical protein [Caballeronia sp. SEWSISQ10-4 2]